MSTWQLTPYAGWYLLAAVISFLLSYTGWKLRSVRGAIYFSLLFLSAGIWTLGYLFGFFNTHLAFKMAMLRVEYLGNIGTNYFWILFACAYVYYDHWLTRRMLVLLGIVPVITLIQILLVDQHTFFYQAHGLATKDGMIFFSKVYGPGFYLWAGYSYLMSCAGCMILTWGLLRMPRQFRGQTIPILLVTGFGLILNLSYISGNNPIAPYDPTPLSFIIIGVLFMVIMRRYRFLDIVPVAYNLVFENIYTGVIISDERAHVLDMNPSAGKILDRNPKDVLGKSILDVLPEHRELIKSFWNTDNIKTEIKIGDDRHIYELQITQLKYKTGKPAGYIIMLFDISDRKRMEKEQKSLIQTLQEKNLQLTEMLEEIKTLKGIIPMCAGCKKIRDDKGYWSQVEQYIQKHSEAQFSHGLCPECNDELYGDKDWYIEMKKKKAENISTSDQNDK
ncbi:MAG: PAS domain-containing protein [Desulfobacteraceae bacterium]|nr:PAS domain-containing protein [Desulfobacteraceae bacterium]